LRPNGLIYVKSRQKQESRAVAGKLRDATVISAQRVIRSTFCLVLHGKVFIIGISNGAISGSIKSRMAAGRQLGKLQWHRAVSLRQHGFLVFALI